MAQSGDPARIRAESARIVAIVIRGRSLGSLLTDDTDHTDLILCLLTF
jgi:hypothetical protein